MNRLYHQLQALRRLLEDAETETEFEAKAGDWCAKTFRSDLYLLQYGEQSVQYFADSETSRRYSVREDRIVSLLRNDRYGENIDLAAYGFNDAEEVSSLFFPLYAYRRHVGGLLFCRSGSEYTAEEKNLAEAVSMQIAQAIAVNEMRSATRERLSADAVHAAVVSMSHSELMAARYVIEELKGDEGVLVASKIADERSITRSVIVNALRKCESAGVIECRSLGMKGTFIRILNPLLRNELER